MLRLGNRPIENFTQADSGNSCLFFLYFFLDIFITEWYKNMVYAWFSIHDKLSYNDMPNLEESNKTTAKVGIKPCIGS